MRNVLLTVSYIGTDFCGWQCQEGQRTVQEEIEKSLLKIHKVPVVLHGSGRTDAGVHARGQTANFLSPIDSIPVQNYLPALNSSLPRDIRIMAACEVPQDFNARFSAVKRTYRYFMHCAKNPAAHELAFSWPIRRYPDVQKLNRMASCLRGEIDCSTFSAAGDKSLSKCRYLENAVFFIEGEKLVFEISANAFLWRMVRSITGTLLEFEQKKYPESLFAEVLQKKDRKLAGLTAPPEGLFLWSVDYEGIRRGPKAQPL